MIRVEFFVDYPAASGGPASLTRVVDLPAVPREGDRIVFVNPGELGGISVTVDFVETYVVGDDVYVRAVAGVPAETAGGEAVAGLEACGFRPMADSIPGRGTPPAEPGSSSRPASPRRAPPYC